MADLNAKQETPMTTCICGQGLAPPDCHDAACLPSRSEIAPVLADEIRMFAHAYGQWLPLDLARHLATHAVQPLVDRTYDRGFMDGRAQGRSDAAMSTPPASWPEEGQS